MLNAERVKRNYTFNEPQYRVTRSHMIKETALIIERTIGIFMKRIQT